MIKPTNLTINVEIKTGIVFYPGIEGRVLELTERLGMKERVIYSSFNHYTIRKIKEVRPRRLRRACSMKMESLMQWIMHVIL